MTKKELNKFKTMLTAKQTELAPQLRKRDGIAIEKTSDMIDEIHLASERELMTHNLERESEMLRDVRAALARMQEGAYGTCLNCEEEIGLKRLQAVPWTRIASPVRSRTTRTAAGLNPPGCRSGPLDRENSTGIVSRLKLVAAFALR